MNKAIQKYKDRHNNINYFIVLNTDNNLVEALRMSEYSLLKTGKNIDCSTNDYLIKTFYKQLNQILKNGTLRVQSVQSVVDFTLFHMGFTYMSSMDFNFFLENFNRQLEIFMNDRTVVSRNTKITNDTLSIEVVQSLKIDDKYKINVDNYVEVINLRGLKLIGKVTDITNSYITVAGTTVKINDIQNIRKIKKEDV